MEWIRENRCLADDAIRAVAAAKKLQVSDYDERPDISVHDIAAIIGQHYPQPPRATIQGAIEALGTVDYILLSIGNTRGICLEDVPLLARRTREETLAPVIAQLTSLLAGEGEARGRGAKLVRSSFIDAMEAELAANARKGDWRSFVPAKEYVRPWLQEHTDKLHVALGDGDVGRVREHAADIANIAMKIEECFGPPAPTLPPTPGEPTDGEKIEWAISRADSIRHDSENHIPYYAYGDNEAACEMAGRLNEVNKQAAELVNHLAAMARSQEGGAEKS